MALLYGNCQVFFFFFFFSSSPKQKYQPVLREEKKNRHGWGCEPDPAGAVDYLSKAAANAATVESLALQAGMKKGGAAKGELVLAIFELANCFRHGWGVPKDAVAAKQVRTFFFFFSFVYFCRSPRLRDDRGTQVIPSQQEDRAPAGYFLHGQRY